jgi:hypothetical protein
VLMPPWRSRPWWATAAASRSAIPPFLEDALAPIPSWASSLTLGPATTWVQQAALPVLVSLPMHAYTVNAA